jgi:hypothetical protein
MVNGKVARGEVSVRTDISALVLALESSGTSDNT